MYRDLTIKGFGQDLYITDSSVELSDTGDLRVSFGFSGRRYTFTYANTVWRDERGAAITPLLADIFQSLLQGILQFVRV